MLRLILALWWPSSTAIIIAQAAPTDGGVGFFASLGVFAVTAIIQFMWLQREIRRGDRLEGIVSAGQQITANATEAIKRAADAHEKGLTIIDRAVHLMENLPNKDEITRTRYQLERLERYDRKEA